MEEPQNTTEKRITLIAQGNPNLEKILQLFNEIFDAPDYLTVLRGHPKAQQYVDGLFKVHHPALFVKFPFT